MKAAVIYEAGGPDVLEIEEACKSPEAGYVSNADITSDPYPHHLQVGSSSA